MDESKTKCPVCKQEKRVLTSPEGAYSYCLNNKCAKYYAMEFEPRALKKVEEKGAVSGGAWSGSLFKEMQEKGT